MNAFFSPLWMILLKWTVLLALGWGGNWLLRYQHARWRLMLWRSVLCFGLVIAAVSFLPVPLFQIPVDLSSSSSVETPITMIVPTAGNSSVKESRAVQLPAKPEPTTATVHGSQSPKPITVYRPIPWQTVCMLVWAFGVVFAGARLIRFQFQLRRLRQKSAPANPVLVGLVRDITAKLGLRRAVVVRISDEVSSPFACGLFRPTIILPKALATDLSFDELSVLLTHEVAHFYRHDLFWCVAWRWAQALLWLHPLAWKIPVAHNLACEQEADRIASTQLEDRELYASLLARLVLRVLETREVETQLVLNASSQIARRLDYLTRAKLGVWKRRYSIAGLGLIGLVFLSITACQVSKGHRPVAEVPTTTEFKKVLVVVQDEEGKPIADVSIKPTGFRVKGIHAADAYGWRTNIFGPAEKAATDSNGRAYVKYPVQGIPEEKESTGQIIFLVSHPEYASFFDQGYSVDQPEQPIKLTRGIHLEITGYYGGDHQPVPELAPSLTEGVSPDEWQMEKNGTAKFHKLSPGGHLLQVMGRLRTGEIVYSDSFPFTAEKGKSYHFDLEMKPGIRLEGRLDDKVPRPVKNGRVMMDVRPKEYPALTVIEDYYDYDRQYGGRDFWHSYRPINEDGTFVFESVPPGEVDFVAIGDGFVSKSAGEAHNRSDPKHASRLMVPQSARLVAPTTKIDVLTEPSATFEFMAKTEKDKPIEGVSVGIYSSVFRMRGSCGWINQSSEESFREIAHLPDFKLVGETDQNGKLVFHDVPPRRQGIGVSHPKFQVPLREPNGWRDRHLSADFSAGRTTKMNLVMEPVGADFIGER